MYLFGCTKIMLVVENDENGSRRERRKETLKGTGRKKISIKRYEQTMYKKRWKVVVDKDQRRKSDMGDVLNKF